ncbi:MAG: glycosyltransferase family A protein [Flavobacteriales bacterium]|nr:glycosyltransferase family A protein [Flavobacteriales bacterium]
MISVIITTFNYAQYVERAIRSAVEQSVPRDSFEIIVVDDASTDRTKEVLAEYHADARIYHLEKNVGLAAARNYGIHKAKGQFIIFLDADDYFHRDLLKVQKLFLEENNSLDAVSTNYWLVDERGNHIEHVNASENPIACGIMFRKDFLFNIGLYDEGFRAREEEDLRIRWAERYNVYNLIVPLYRYRMHENNLTKNEVAMSKYEEQLKLKHK